ncbi:MAG: thymidylate synthase [Clostridiales bacterium]|jgi:thymidylate synthase|nr:thymidylate synthase [Clostridiales bacterium]
MSLADEIFISNCSEILKNGYSDRNFPVRTRWQDGEKAYTVKRFGIVNRYDLSKEFPAITIRKTFFKSAVDEILWIWQKKSNRLSDLNSGIWNSWADERGTIGKAYGYQLGIKYDYPEGKFDQVDRILFDLKNNPLSRRIIASMYNFSDLNEMNLYPCAYGLTLNVCGGKLNAILNQRSQDMLVANNWNVCQYAVLVHMFAQVSGLAAGELVHVIADAHIYDRHIPIVERIMKNPVYDAPRFEIDESVKDFYQFTTDSFSLKEYKYSELGEKIPVAI